MDKGKPMLKAGAVKALGAMSGTSLDGVDAAVIETDGLEIISFGEAAFRPYTKEETDILRAALGKWQGDALVAAAEVVETAHGEILEGFADVDLIGFHGQTVAHDPRGRGTLQIGDGGLLAAALEKPVVWDFRSADVKLGGEGAPLAPFYHFALAKFIGATEPVAFLNLGGVGNITWVDPDYDKPEEEGALLSFDTGPANAPVNDLMTARLGLSHDEDGALAAQGNVDDDIVANFLEHRYFYRMPPKSLDRDQFKGLSDAVAGLSDADAAATLTACSVMAVVQGLQYCPTEPTKMLVCGGGRKNATLMKMLQAAMDCEVLPVEDVGLDGDMLEAQAFAYLAVRVARGLPTSCPSTTGVKAAVGGGTVSYPPKG